MPKKFYYKTMKNQLQKPLKVLKSHNYALLHEIDTFLFSKNFFKNFLREDIDILLILTHMHLNYAKDGEIEVNTDDILNFRGIKKFVKKGGKSSGYKLSARKSVRSSLKRLAAGGHIDLKEYLKFQFSVHLKFDFKKLDKIRLPLELLTYSPHKHPWHKDFGYFLMFFKFKKPNLSTLQISKILKEIKNDYTFLAPYKIRERFENTLDDLARANIINNWFYKNIDEEELTGKNWLWWWQRLSVKIDFKKPALLCDFLNF